MGCVSSKNARSSPSPPYHHNVLIRLPSPLPKEDSTNNNNNNVATRSALDPEPEPQTEKMPIVSYRFGRMTQGEQVSAGWPAWLTSVASEAIDGWLPLRSNAYEKIDKIGQGTYSSVYRARELQSGKLVAVKKVRFDNFQEESVSFMAREITILRKLDHPNIIKLEGIITSRLSCSIYLVFEYMEHDLSGLLSSPDIKFTDSQIKCYMGQLLAALEHCHSKGVMHRDIKSANILVSNEGILKMADFGLANFMSSEALTNHVITLWYRPPELLLGSTYYGEAVDLWSVGCVFGEFFVGRPILKGRTEVEQLHKIFKLCGTPAEEYWRKSRLPLAPMFKPPHPYENRIRERCKDFSRTAVDLIQTLLSIEPNKRGTAASALKSEYFRTKPYACEPSHMPKFPPTKEMDAKIQEEAKRKCSNEVEKGEDTSKVRNKIPLGVGQGSHRRRGSIESRSSLKPNDDTKSDVTLNSQVSTTHSVPISNNFAWNIKKNQLDTFTRLYSSNQKSNSVKQENKAKLNVTRQHARLHSHRSFDSCDYEPQESTSDYMSKLRKGQSEFSGPLVYRSQEMVSRNYDQSHQRSRFYKD